MTHAEQHKLIEEISEVSRKMTGREREEFEMFFKRNKDDEDLDAISRKRLLDFHKRYVVEGSGSRS